MPMVRAMRMLNAMEAGALSGTELETLLTNDAGREGDLAALCQMRGQSRRMAGVSNTFNALFASQKALDILVNSAITMKEIAASANAMDSIVSSSTIMSVIIQSQIAIDAIFDNSDAKEKYLASTVLSAESNPNMTSNTSPAGQVTYSNQYTDYPAYYALNTNNSYWDVNSSEANQWVAYDFGHKVAVNQVDLLDYGGTESIYDFEIQGSDDGNTWKTVFSGNHSGALKSYAIGSIPHQHWRLFMPTTHPSYPYVYRFILSGWEVS